MFESIVESVLMYKAEIGMEGTRGGRDSARRIGWE
jgi:hypothetical protein